MLKNLQYSARLCWLTSILTLLLTANFSFAQALPLEPAFTHAPAAKDGKSVGLLPMNPQFRTYLEDALIVGNFYTTKAKVGPAGKVWVAYEVTGVTLDDSMAGGVDLNVALEGANESKVPPELLHFNVVYMTPNPVVLEKALALRQMIESPQADHLARNARELFGATGYQTFLDRLGAKGAHKRMLIVRHYEVEPDLELGFKVDFKKAEGFVPLSVKLMVGDEPADLDRLFNKDPRGNYAHVVAAIEPWYTRNRGLLALLGVIVVVVGARAVIGRKI